MFLLKSKCVNYLVERHFALLRPQALLDAAVSTDITEHNLKPKKHPGVMRLPAVKLPEIYSEAIVRVVGDHPLKKLAEDTLPLQRHLKGRVSPMEGNELDEMREKITRRVLKKVNPDEENAEQKVKDKVMWEMKNKVYNWKSINWDEYNSLLYLVGRAAADYAVLLKVFIEINKRDVDFQPRSMFDFGSGVGTAMWASREIWKKSIFEYFNVDSSSCMNDLSMSLLRYAWKLQDPASSGIYYRQFLPSKLTTYDLVIASYSLLELPTLKSRLETLFNLWKRTSKYLVLIENGTNGGFRVINEARDFILQQTEHKGHVFSPCPHDTICPRFITDSTPCNFPVKYFPLTIGIQEEAKQELYCYVVMKKGDRSKDDQQWPRIVREVLLRSGHSVCRMCSKEGRLEEVVFSAGKHGRLTHRCARASRWGDLMPVNLVENKEKES